MWGKGALVRIVHSAGGHDPCAALHSSCLQHRVHSHPNSFSSHHPSRIMRLPPPLPSRPSISTGYHAVPQLQCGPSHRHWAPTSPHLSDIFSSPILTCTSPLTVCSVLSRRPCTVQRHLPYSPPPYTAENVLLSFHVPTHRLQCAPDTSTGSPPCAALFSHRHWASTSPHLSHTSPPPCHPPPFLFHRLQCGPRMCTSTTCCTALSSTWGSSSSCWRSTPHTWRHTSRRYAGRGSRRTKRSSTYLVYGQEEQISKPCLLSWLRVSF